MIRNLWEMIVNVFLHGANIGLDVLGYVRGSLSRTAQVVRHSLIVLTSGLLVGLWVQKYSLTAGSFILNVTSLVALGIGLWAVLRIAVLVQICVRGSEVLTAASEAISADHVKFPELLEEVEAEKIIRWSAFLLLAISGAGTFANIFPAYRDINAFLGCVVITSFCLIMYNMFAFENKWRIAERTLMFAFVMLLVKIAAFVVPLELQREFHDTITHESNKVVQQRQDSRQLDQSHDGADHGAVTYEQRAIQTLASQRDSILAAYANTGTLSSRDRNRLNDINSRIAELKEGKLTQAEEDESSVWAYMPVGKTATVALFVAVLLVLAASSKRTKNQPKKEATDGAH